MPIHSAVGTSIRKTSLLRIVPTACGQAADKLTPFATCPHDQSSELAHERDFHHVRCSERSYLFTMSDILQISVQARARIVCGSHRTDIARPPQPCRPEQR